MKTTFIAAALGVALALSSTVSLAITLRLNPATLEVAVGDTVTLDLEVDELGDGIAPSLSAYDLDVTYDPALFGFLSATFGTGLDVLNFGFNFPEATNDVTGTVNLVEVSLDTVDDLNDLQPASFTLATLTFTTKAMGSSRLGLVVNALGDAAGNKFFEPTITGGNVTITEAVTTAPEPASTALWAVGLLGLLVTHRRVR